MTKHRPIRIGLLGLGTVGQGVVKLLSRQPYAEVTQIAVLNPDKPRPVLSTMPHVDLSTPEAIVADPDIDIVVEVMGGLEYSYQQIKAALAAGKHVVTANKVVIAHHGPELLQLAQEKGVNLLFEAAVAGGIPIVLPMKASLAGNHIMQLAGILNGTTNYILTQMEQANLDFDVALKQAQEKGFAEADPTADIEGHDAACKLGILAMIAARTSVDVSQIHTEGITQVTAEDIRMARELGFVIRLIASAQFHPNGGLDLRVHPMLIPMQHPLAKVMNENNAIWVQGDAVGEVMFYGKGAGEMPTASSVTGDVLLIANTLQLGVSSIPGLNLQLEKNKPLVPIQQTDNTYYVRIEAEDVPGVLGSLGQACGSNNVSIQTLMQLGKTDCQGRASIILLTHQVNEGSLQAALSQIAALETTHNIHCVFRVFAS